MKSIRYKIIVFAILSTLIPSFGFGVLSFQQNETMIGENVTRELRALANYASRELDFWIKDQILTVRELATTKILIDALSLENRASRNKQKNQKDALSLYLKSVQKRLDTVLELTVIDIEGKSIASNVDAPIPIMLDANWAETASSHGEVVIQPQWNTHYATPILGISVPILSEDDFALGALIVTFDMHELQSYLKDKTQSPLGDVLLIDRNGKTMLTSSDRNSEDDFSANLDDGVIERLLERSGEYTIFSDSRQRQLVGLAYTTARIPVAIIASRSYQSVYEAWEYQRTLFVWLVGLVLLFVAAIAVRMSHTIVSSLQKLIDATQKIVKGELDVVLTTVQHDEIGRLMQMFNQMADQLRQNQIQIETANAEMQQKNQQLERLSVTDSLTGLYNRNKLNSIISDQLARYERNARTFSILMIDIDHFKVLNDNFGHVAGDEIIVSVAKKISQSIRSIDYAARYGGDEFIVILPESVVDDAIRTAERIRIQVSSVHCSTLNKTIEVTLSIGVIQSEPEDVSLTALLSRVDGALYEAKRSGRNKVFSIRPRSGS